MHKRQDRRRLCSHGSSYLHKYSPVPGGTCALGWEVERATHQPRRRNPRKIAYKGCERAALRAHHHQRRRIFADRLSSLALSRFLSSRDRARSSCRRSPLYKYCPRVSIPPSQPSLSPDPPDNGFNFGLPRKLNLLSRSALLLRLRRVSSFYHERSVSIRLRLPSFPGRSQLLLSFVLPTFGSKSFYTPKVGKTGFFCDTSFPLLVPSNFFALAHLAELK